MRSSIALFVLVVMAAPAAAQTRTATRGSASEPSVSFRPFFLAAGEQFAASKTFEAAFDGKSSGPFWGGGLQVDFGGGLFVELSASRFSKSGQRAFVSNGQAFPLGIPLKATITPLEIAAGGRVRVTPRVIPYAAAGISRYAYTETSDLSAGGEDVSAGHIGFVAFGGVEVRVHPWIGIGVEAQFTRIHGILGDAGTSQAFGETDLGGTAVRVKVLVGR